LRRPRRTEDLREYNAVLRLKDTEIRLTDTGLTDSDLKIALIFPNAYEVGIANLGFLKVYQLINSIEGVVCERFFYNKSFKKYYSLDTLRPIDEFNVMAFSVSFELDYPNIMEMLDVKKIPLRAVDRSSNHPLIMMGGPVTYFNIKPLWPIGDLFFHGDAENKLGSVVRTIRDAYNKNDNKEILLDRLATCENLSIPALNKENTRIEKFIPIDESPSVSPFISKKGAFGKRTLIEIGRGCLRNCAFCVAGHTRNPARFLSPEQFSGILNDQQQLGIHDVGLISATFTDHPRKAELLQLLEDRKMAFSVSSLRLDSLSQSLLNGLKRSGQQVITIAPEGSSQRVRNSLAKDLTEQDIISALEKIARSGFNGVKMYFIYGIEGEDENDFKDLLKILRETKRLGIDQISLSFNPLVPKPGTPLEGTAMQDIKRLKAKKKFIQKLLSGKTRTKFESLRKSVEQYRLANGNQNTLFEIYHNK